MDHNSSSHALDTFLNRHIWKSHPVRAALKVNYRPSSSDQAFFNFRSKYPNIQNSTNTVLCINETADSIHLSTRQTKSDSDLLFASHKAGLVSNAAVMFWQGTHSRFLKSQAPPQTPFIISDQRLTDFSGPKNAVIFAQGCIFCENFTVNILYLMWSST